MGSLIFIAVTALLILTGCLEGQYRGPDYGSGSGTEVSSNLLFNSKWYPLVDSALFMQPLGYPTRGAFLIGTIRAEVSTEAALIEAIEAQEGPMVLTVVGDVTLSQPVKVRHPLVLQTTNAFGIPNSSLQFMKSSGAASIGGQLVVENADFNQPDGTCPSDVGLVDYLVTQMFVRIEGNITRPNIALLTPTHLALNVKSAEAATSIEIWSADRRSTIAIKGNSQIVKGDRFEGRFVLIGREGVLRDSIVNSLSPNPTIALVSQMKRDEYGYLPPSSVCFDRNLVETALLRAYMSDREYNRNIQTFGEQNMMYCENDRWFYETLVRTKCAAVSSVGGTK